MRSRAILYLLTLLVGLVSGRKPALCKLEPGVRGYCFSYRARFSYYPRANTCKTFKYSGCAGNHNRFVTKEFCEYQCVD